MEGEKDGQRERERDGRGTERGRRGLERRKEEQVHFPR